MTMKAGLGRLGVVAFVAAGFAGAASAESLAEAAKKERERRAKLQAEQAEKARQGDKSAGPAKTYTETEIQNAKGENFSQATGPVFAPPPSTSSPPRSTRPSLTPGAGTSSSGGGSTAALEQRVRDLERQRAGLPPGPFGPSTPCTEGARVRSTVNEGPVHLRDAPKVRVCEATAYRENEAQRVQAELDQARAALDQARR